MLFEDFSGRKPLDTGGGRVFSLDAFLIFWPRAGAFGAGAISRLCAQLLWCELYDMRDTKKK